MCKKLNIPVFTESTLFIQEAQNAKKALRGKKALGQKLVVDWAKPDVVPSKNVSHCLLICYMTPRHHYTLPDTALSATLNIIIISF